MRKDEFSPIVNKECPSKLGHGVVGYIRDGIRFCGTCNQPVEEVRMEKFWMVIREAGPGSDTTKYRYTTEEAANAEAERLSRASQGAALIILEAKRACKAEQSPVIWEDIPG